MAGQGDPDPQAVQRGGEDPAATVQGPEGACAADHAQAGAEGGGEETEGGADEEAGRPGRPVRSLHCRNVAAAKC